MILLYLLLAPPMLVAQGIATYLLLPVMFVVSFAVLTVDELSAETETPFGHDACDLPLENYCNIILKQARNGARLNSKLAFEAEMRGQQQ